VGEENRQTYKTKAPRLWCLDAKTQN